MLCSFGMPTVQCGVPVPELHNSIYSLQWEVQLELCNLELSCVIGDGGTATALLSPRASENVYRKGRTRKLINSLYDGSVRNLVVALCTPGNLTKKEREELQQ